MEYLDDIFFARQELCFLQPRDCGPDACVVGRRVTHKGPFLILVEDFSGSGHDVVVITLVSVQIP